MDNLDKFFSEGFQKQKNSMQSVRPNILVCGYTGSGKSSLIRSILGDIVPASAVGSGKPQTQGYDRYENENIVIYDSKGLELGETEDAFLYETEQFIRARQMRNLQDIENHIHLVWYTIQGPGARVTDCDKHLMQKIFNPASTIAIITKGDSTRPNQENAIRKIIQETGIPNNHIILTSDEEGGSIGIEQLMRLSAQMLPAATQNAFYAAQTVNTELKIKAVMEKKGMANTIIATATTAAALVGANPIPFSDALILGPGQLVMIGSLAALYEQKQEFIKNAMLPVIARSTGIMAASSLTKFLPGIGSVINAGVAGALTGAMGWYVQARLEQNAI
ncbi:MAG: 50S ribosome-binding GTPase, partial [Thermoguttaceae bacterium]|nr:50S ribosome-binding GTPase [Thermoguttaceae bacterium]